MEAPVAVQTPRGVHRVMLANITSASRKALEFLCSSGCHMAAVVETHLDVREAQAAQRMLHAKGYKAWFSVRFTPTSSAAPPPGEFC